MKFTYDEKQDRGECVAYITDDNSLIIRDELDCIYIDGDGTGNVGSWMWMPDDEATRKFYPGDKITIEF